ncbi:MAG: translation factor, partial [Phycisphaerae bacterium]|nr:translation factor [Phycisphaerae bacterium]
IERMARTRILFICTGNLSRSPLAEALAEQVLAEKYGCRPGELDQWGVEVNSAGVAAMDGAPAATDARIAVHDYGTDLQKHRSRMLRVDALLSSDYIFGMTRSHVMAAQAMAPEAAARVELLRPDGREVDDPVSGGAEAHRRCAKEIYEALRKRIAEKVI